MELLCAAIGCLVVCISTCGTHAASYTARLFTYSSTAVSWNTAYATCSLTRGHLITVDNNVTINVLKYIRAQPEAAAVSNDIWIGLYNAAPTSDVPVYIWAECKHLDDSNTVWFPGEPNFVQTDRCIITSPEYEWKTRNCSEKHAFFCETVLNVDCTFEKQTGQKCEMGGVLLSEKMSEDACATRCQEDMDGSDVCWAYEYNLSLTQCKLLFGSDPYICETLQESKGFTTGRRRCFKFSDITGSEVASPVDLYPGCSTTEVTTSTETPSTSVEATTYTSATTSTTQTRRVMISTLETTATTTTTIPATTSAVTTSTTPSTTVMISSLEATTTTTTHIPATTSAVTTISTSPSTTVMISSHEATTTTTTTIPTATSAVTTLNPTSMPETTADTTVAPIKSETSATSIATTQDAKTTAETTLETASTASDSAVTTSVTPTVTTTTASSPMAEVTTTITAKRDTDTPTSIPGFSTTAPSNNATGTSYSPTLDTFLSRLEAVQTSSTSASTPTVISPGRYVYEVCVAVQTFTVDERKKRTDDIVTDLTLDKKNLSSYRRKKSSAEDERPSAQSVGGGVAIMLLVTAALIIILPDCSSILMHVLRVHKKKQLVPAQQ